MRFLMFLKAFLLKPPRVAMPDPSEIQISNIEFHSNEKTILIIMIFKVDSNCVHPRFQLRVYMWSRVNISDRISKILRNRLLEIKWCGALSSRGQVSEIWGVLQQRWRIPLFTKFHIVKLYPNKEFSILIIMIFDVDSIYVHPRF